MGGVPGWSEVSYDGVFMVHIQRQHYVLHTSGDMNYKVFILFNLKKENVGRSFKCRSPNILSKAFLFCFKILLVVLIHFEKNTIKMFKPV